MVGYSKKDVEQAFDEYQRPFDNFCNELLKQTKKTFTKAELHIIANKLGIKLHNFQNRILPKAVKERVLLRVQQGVYKNNCHELRDARNAKIMQLAYEGYSQRQISDEVGMSVSAVNKVLNKKYKKY